MGEKGTGKEMEECIVCEEKRKRDGRVYVWEKKKKGKRLERPENARV